jgi:hypothetical protein
MNLNPYSAPATSPSKVYSGDSCPQCKGTNVRAPKFTWWGGILGPKLFHHRVCESCGFAFNAKTGRSNKRAVLLYAGGGVVLGIGIGLAGAFYLVLTPATSGGSVDLTAVKRGCMKTCQTHSPAAQCETGCSCIVHELEQMDPKKLASLMESTTSSQSLPPEIEAAQKRCMTAPRP